MKLYDILFCSLRPENCTFDGIQFESFRFSSLSRSRWARLVACRPILRNLSGRHYSVRYKVSALFICCFFLLCGHAGADFESEVVELVNAERQAQGLHPLTSDERLANAARGHSEDMGLQDYFSHDSLDGRHFFDRIVEAGYAYNHCGENIAAGYPTPKAVVQGWMDSPGHRANILDPAFCDIGVGYAYVGGSTYGHYWTQDFGRRQGLSLCPGVSEHTIVSSAGAGGDISPAGEVTVQTGGSKTFSVTPDSGYCVKDVLVDGRSIGIVLSYTFTDLDDDHDIEAIFELNTSAPAAEAGSAQVAEVGQSITLDGTGSRDANDAVVTYAWAQTGGPPTTLSAEDDAAPTFVATPAMINSTLIFELTVYDSGGFTDADSVQVDIIDNGIAGFPPEVITFNSFTDKGLGIRIENGGVLTFIYPMDPQDDSVSDTAGMPQDLIYGLIDFKVNVDAPGNEAAVILYLPEAIPDGYRWYKYNREDGWYDFSDHVSVNAAGDQVRLTLVDGGIGDDDGEQNGVISDPIGLGLSPSSSNGGGGCFIKTAANGSNPQTCSVSGFAGAAVILLGLCPVKRDDKSAKTRKEAGPKGPALVPPKG
jgi:uncharacterized protein YkwD